MPRPARRAAGRWSSTSTWRCSTTTTSWVRRPRPRSSAQPVCATWPSARPWRASWSSGRCWWGWGRARRRRRPSCRRRRPPTAAAVRPADRTPGIDVQAGARPRSDAPGDHRHRPLRPDPGRLAGAGRPRRRRRDLAEPPAQRRAERPPAARPDRCCRGGSGQPPAAPAGGRHADRQGGRGSLRRTDPVRPRPRRAVAAEWEGRRRRLRRRATGEARRHARRGRAGPAAAVRVGQRRRGGAAALGRVGHLPGRSRHQLVGSG